RSFFVVKNARGAAEILKIVSGDFDDAAFRREISFQDDQPARGFERSVEFANHFLLRRFLRGVGFFAERAAGDGEAIAAEKSRFQEALRNQRGAACRIQIGGHELSTRLQIGKNRNARTDAVEIVDGKESTNPRHVVRGEWPSASPGSRTSGNLQ